MGTIAVGERNKMLDAWGSNTTYTATAAVWVKLHIGSAGLGRDDEPGGRDRPRGGDLRGCGLGRPDQQRRDRVDLGEHKRDLHPHQPLDRIVGGHVPGLGRHLPGSRDRRIDGTNPGR